MPSVPPESNVEFTASDVLSADVWSGKSPPSVVGIDVACTKISVDLQSLRRDTADATIQRNLQNLVDLTISDCAFLALIGEDAKFGLSEVNWGILPGGFVSKALTDALSLRDAVWYAVTGETFDGKMAEKIRLVNKAVPREKLREETIALAQRLLKLNPEVIKATKNAVKNVRSVPHEQAADYLQAKSQELRFVDRESGREKGMSQFLDDKSYRPGYGPYARPAEQKA